MSKTIVFSFVLICFFFFFGPLHFISINNSLRERRKGRERERERERLERRRFFFLYQAVPLVFVFSFHFGNSSKEDGPHLAVVQDQGDPWRGRSKLLSALRLAKIHLIESSSMSYVSAIKLIRTDTTLDLSQKAEKRCLIYSFAADKYFFCRRSTCGRN